jgi:hypothetical protein
MKELRIGRGRKNGITNRIVLPFTNPEPLQEPPDLAMFSDPEDYNGDG